MRSPKHHLVDRVSSRLGISSVKASAVLVCGLCAIVALAALLLSEFWPSSAQGASSEEGEGVVLEQASADASSGGEEGGDGGQESAERVIVDVAGAVNLPQVVELPKGSRVCDAIELAGGARDDAQLSAVNLARELVDGEQVYVPAVGEAVSTSGAEAGAAVSGGDTGGLVNINTATAKELEELPGIGEVMAQRIVDERESGGPYTSVDDLSRVSGIGDKRLEQLRDLVCV